MRKNGKKLATLACAAVLAFGAFALAGCSSSSEEASSTTPENPVIRVSTTTSVNDSGLIPYLQPYFEEETGYQLEVTSNGTGAAIRLGESGDADLLLVHNEEQENEFVEAGYGIERIPFMYNYFVIVGPESDPASIADDADAAEAFSDIAANGETSFVSRGDESGTHSAELAIWDSIGIDPTGESWYVSAGQGMGATLTQTSELQGYTLTDKGTFLSMADSLDLEILLEQGDDLMNTYSLIAVNPDLHEGINYEGAQAFIDWMTSDSTLELIAEYGVEEYGQPLFYIFED